jgi:hypothetical protein
MTRLTGEGGLCLRASHSVVAQFEKRSDSLVDEKQDLYIIRLRFNPGTVPQYVLSCIYDVVVTADALSVGRGEWCWSRILIGKKTART